MVWKNRQYRSNIGEVDGLELINYWVHINHNHKMASTLMKRRYFNQVTFSVDILIYLITFWVLGFIIIFRLVDWLVSLLLWAEDTNNGVQACKVTIAEMKDKLISLEQIVAKLQEELRYKQDVLNQVHQQVLPDVQACGTVKDGISKCTQALRKIQVCVRFALVMASKHIWWLFNVFLDIT